jgi:hypothetical protein
MAARRFFQANAVALVVFYLILAIHAVFTYFHAGEFFAVALRFEPRQLRGGANAAFANVSIESFGLLVDGCRRPPTAPLAPWPSREGVAEDGAGHGGSGGVVARYDSLIRANGYYWTTAAAGPAGAELDPVSWSVYSSELADNGGGWAAVGASTWRLELFSDGSLQLYPQLPYPTPLAGPRGVEVVVDHRPSWLWVLPAIVVNFNNAVCFLLCVMAGITGQGHITQAIWVWMFGFGFMLDAAVCVAHLAIGQVRESLARLFFLPGTFIMTLGILAGGPLVIEFLLAYGVLGIAARCALHLGLYSSPPLLFLLTSLLSPAAAAVFVSSLVLTLRLFDIVRAHRLVAPDRKLYDAAWAEVVNNPAGRADIEEIKRLADQLAVRSWQIRPRQYNRRRPPSSTAPADAAAAAARGMLAAVWRRTPLLRSNASTSLSAWMLCAGQRHEICGPSPELDIRRPVDCVDQLRVQAWLLSPILKRKVQGWAGGSDGCFPLSSYSGGGFARFGKACRSKGPEGRGRG